MGQAVGGREIVLGDKGDAQIQPLGRLEDGLLAAGGVQGHEEMQARLLPADLHLPRQGGLAESRQELVPQGPVVVAHSVDVFFKVALGQEPGQGHLLQAGDGPRIEPQSLIEPGDQMAGQHQVADPEGRRQALGEGVDVDDLLHHVDALQGGDGPAGQAELTVVVVLDDVPVLPLGGPAEQFIPAAHRHDDARGEVVGGGDVEDLRPALLQLFGDDPPLVHGDVVDGHVVLLIDLAQPLVAGVLHGVSPVPAQELDQHPIEILRPRPHHDLLRGDGHPPELVEVVGNGLAELADAPGGGVGEQGGLVLGGGHVPQELHPDGEGEHVPGHGTAHKVCPVGPLFRGLPLASLWGGRGRRRRDGGLLLQLTDVIPPLGQGIEEPLRHQLGIGTLHSDGAHPQVFGKTPFGGQLLPCPEFFLEDILLDAPVEVLVHALRCDIFKGVGKQTSPLLSSGL